MAHTGIKGLRATLPLSFFQKILFKLKNSEQLHLEANQLLADYCEPYVPYETGTLAKPVVTAKAVIYTAPYARYQYEGVVYGPNIPIYSSNDRDNPTEFIGWWSIAPKSPTDRELGVPHSITDKFGNQLVFGYNTSVHPKAAHHWDKRMLEEKGDEFRADIEQLVKRHMKFW